MENTKKYTGIIIIILLIVGIYFLWDRKETWLGFYYPDGCLTCKEKYIFSPEFKDRASCLSWTTNLKAQRNNSADLFECGKNCKVPDSPDGLYICEETVDY